MLKKAIIKSATFLDIKHELGEYHGNYQSARKPNAVIEYMLKKEDGVHVMISFLKSGVNSFNIFVKYNKIYHPYIFF